MKIVQYTVEYRMTERRVIKKAHKDNRSWALKSLKIKSPLKTRECAKKP